MLVPRTFIVNFCFGRRLRRNVRRARPLAIDVGTNRLARVIAETLARTDVFTVTSEFVR